MRGVFLQQVNETTDEAVNETTDVVDRHLPFLPEWVVEPLLALVVLVVGWYASKLVVRYAGRTVARHVERPSVTRAILRGVRMGVLLLAAVIAASILDIGRSEILLSVGVISAVVAVVLAPLIGSLINGLFVLADRSYEIGDMIEVADQGYRGFVEDITIRYTKIFTLDNTFIVVPNSEIHTRDVVNYSAEDERTRISIQFEVTYESDVDEARRLAERAARDVDTVIAGGPDIRIGSARYSAAPTCFIEEYADSGVLLTLRLWVKHPYKLLVVRSAVQERIRDRFADADVEFAYPHRHHVFDGTSGQARVAVGSPLEADGDPSRRSFDSDGDQSRQSFDSDERDR